MVDTELRDALAGINAQLSDLGKVVRSAETEAKQANYRAERLERAVFGSLPPSSGMPPSSSPGVTIPPAFAHGGEASSPGVGAPTPSSPKPIALAMRVVSGEERATKIESRVERIERMNVEQCKAMGVSSETGDEDAHASAFDRLVTFALSREGRNLGLRVVTLVLAALAASHAGSADDSAKEAVKVVHTAPALATPSAMPYGADGGVKP